MKKGEGLGAGIFTDMMHKCPETMPVGLWDQDPDTDDLVASYSLYVGRIFREGRIGGAPRGGRRGS